MPTQNAQQSGTASAGEQSAQQVVQDFISALERLDLEATAALASDDIRWINYPLKTCTDKKGFEKALHGMFRNATLFDVQYNDIHERGDGIVYTDRIDVFEGGGVKMRLPVQGEFRVRNGLVTEWVDRFSWPKLLGELGRSLPGVLNHYLRRR